MATVAFLAAATGIVLFAGGYRATLEQGAVDQATFAVPLDVSVRSGQNLRRPLDVADETDYTQLAPDVLTAKVVRATAGIRVNAVCPGAVDTAMSNPSLLDPDADREESAKAVDGLYRKLVPLGRIGRPEEVARLALFLTCDDSSYITGQPFVIDGGWLAGVSII